MIEMGKVLQRMEKATEVGIIPEKLGETAAQTKGIVAQLLDMSTEEIEQKLTAKWIKTKLLCTNWYFKKREPDRMIILN